MTCAGESQRKYTCAACRNKIPLDDLEAVFQEQLRAFALVPEAIAAHLTEADQAIAEKRALLASLDAEAKRLRDEAAKVYRLYVTDQVGAEGFGELNRP